MKAHQNQDMRNDEMKDHAIYMERRNLREVAYVIIISTYVYQITNVILLFV